MNKSSFSSNHREQRSMQYLLLITINNTIERRPSHSWRQGDDAAFSKLSQRSFRMSHWFAHLRNLAFELQSNNQAILLYRIGEEMTRLSTPSPLTERISKYAV